MSLASSVCRLASAAVDVTDAAERQASAGAHDGVKGERRTLAVRAPLHALVRRPTLEGSGGK